MAIQNLTTRPKYNPVHNPLVYGFLSDNINKKGFRYVIEIYDNDTNKLIYESRVAPRPVDGIGYIDCSKVLSNYINGEVKLDDDTSYNLLDGYIDYTVKVGEEYNLEWNFTDSGYYGGATFNNTYFFQQPNNTPHPFSVGDNIVVRQINLNNGFVELEGLQTVKEVPNAYQVVINKPALTGPTNPGFISFADNRKTVYKSLLEFENEIAYNSAFSFAAFPSYDQSNYLFDNNEKIKCLLVDIDLKNYQCPLNGDVYVNYLVADTSNIEYIYFKNDSNNIFKKLIVKDKPFNQVAIGCNNHGTLTRVSGSGNLIEDNTKYYDVYFTNFNGWVKSKRYRINIDRRCKIDNAIILFEDSKGSYISQSFSLRLKENGTIERDNYNRPIGKFDNGNWNYNPATDAGLSNIHISNKKEYTLTTNWMNHHQNILFEKLLISPNTYLKLDDTYQRAIIKDSNYTVQQSTDKSLIKKTITVQLANQNSINL